MTEKPKVDVRLYRPQFMVEKELAQIKEAEAAQEVRTCQGFRDDRSARTNQLSRYLRWYCSGDCIRNAKAHGVYRDD
jgi:hypothetical protein